MNKFTKGDKVILAGKAPELVEITDFRYAPAIKTYIYTVKLPIGLEIDVSESMINNTVYGTIPIGSPNPPVFRTLSIDDLPVHLDIIIQNEHDGHTVIDNVANGKPFRYCKDCKVEV